MSTGNSQHIPAKDGIIGVVLMTYGSATTAEHVPAYFERIYKGKASATTIADFENRYRLIGRSPLVDITESQAAHLQERLGSRYVVSAGMRHSSPSIEDAVAQCVAEGAESLVGIILSPQFSSFIMEGYRTAFNEAAAAHGLSGKCIVAGSWETEQHFVELLARRTQESLARLDAAFGTVVPVIFTTHSLPQRVVEKDPNYLQQLTATIEAIRALLQTTDAHATERVWRSGYQSAGHTPEEWLTPDLYDLLKESRAAGASAVLIVPIQFLADHLEILYDLDIAAKAQCEELGVAYNRIELPNTDPLFIEALAEVVNSTGNPI